MLPALSVEETSVNEAETAGAGSPAKARGVAKPRSAKPSSSKPKSAAKKPAAKKAPAKSPAKAAAKPKATAKPAAKVTAKATVKATARPAPKKATPKATVKAAAKLPVRAGEDSWTEAELAEVRAALDADMAALRAEITHSELQIAEDAGGDGAGDDQADAGAKTYSREHEMALAHNARDLLLQNERAVGRMDSGTYGVCEECDRPIGKARLQAFPRATLCVACKQREERR